MTYWQRWLRKPQTLWLRKATFQLHLWSGIGLGLYVLLISVTGSILVYRNELYRAATPDPILVTATGAPLTDEQLKGSATRAYPGYRVVIISHPPNPNQAVSISLEGVGNGHKTSRRNRLFNQYTGADLGDSVPLGVWAVSKLLSLHDDLLGGTTGRKINGVGALLIVVLSLTGIVVWWPGMRTWRRSLTGPLYGGLSLTIPRGVGWQRLIWGLHSMMGFWCLGFILLFALSGVYLSSPDLVQDLADRIEPLTDANLRTRTVDQLIYWLAYLHFGRINGIGIPCRGPGLCDMATKLTWAVVGLAPAGMFVTGAVMWWNRVVRKRVKKLRSCLEITLPNVKSFWEGFRSSILHGTDLCED
jgi:uncharacterized iron-regulated membrane protein